MQKQKSYSYSDASDYVIWAVIMHKYEETQKPSHMLRIPDSLQKKKTNYSQFKKELLAIILPVK